MTPLRYIILENEFFKYIHEFEKTLIHSKQVSEFGKTL